MRAISEWVNRARSFRLVEISGDDPWSVGRVKQAWHWLSGKPEVVELARRAYEQTGAPLKIYARNGTNDPGAYNSLFHSAEIDPVACYQLTTLAENGDVISYTPERVIAHELLHATQGDERNEDYKANLALRSILMATVPYERYERYEHRIAAAKTPKQLRAIFTKIYDREVLPVTIEAYTRANTDPKIIQYLATIERPAVDFENHLMGKYCNAPQRANNYLDTLFTDEKREHYIQDKVQKVIDWRNAEAEAKTTAAR